MKPTPKRLKKSGSEKRTLYQIKKKLNDAIALLDTLTDNSTNDSKVFRDGFNIDLTRCTIKIHLALADFHEGVNKRYEGINLEAYK